VVQGSDTHEHSTDVGMCVRMKWICDDQCGMKVMAIEGNHGESRFLKIDCSQLRSGTSDGVVG
jgi:hypothetical protein